MLLIENFSSRDKLTLDSLSFSYFGSSGNKFSNKLSEGNVVLVVPSIFSIADVIGDVSEVPEDVLAYIF